MAFKRHVAIASKDPAGTAEFYKNHFDLKELYRKPKNTGDDGVWLSDGYIDFAILKYEDRRAPARTRAVIGFLWHPPYRVHGRRSEGDRHRAGGRECATRERAVEQRRDVLVRPATHRMRSSSGRTGCISTFVKKAGTRPSDPTPSSMN